MIVVKMVGGIGNQMFQYALFRRLLEMGKDVQYDSLQTKEHNGFEIDRVFNIVQQPIKSLEEIRGLRVVPDTWPIFNEKFLNTPDNVYLEGNWQHLKYFPSEEILRKDLSFKQELDDKNKLLLEEIQNSNSVSIHVRRGDFLHDGIAHYWPDWFNYFGIAINYITKNAKQRPIKFFVFSDDIEWCKKNFMIPMVYSENQGPSGGWKDMMLMSYCKHNISINSTFSWWGAWLNKNPGKIVITPKQWFINENHNKITQSLNINEWIKI